MKSTGEGNSFQGVKDRLRMFEENKISIVQTPSSNVPTVRLVPSSIRRTSDSPDQSTKQKICVTPHSKIDQGRPLPKTQTSPLWKMSSPPETPLKPAVRPPVKPVPEKVQPPPKMASGNVVAHSPQIKLKPPPKPVQEGSVPTKMNSPMKVTQNTQEPIKTSENIPQEKTTQLPPVKIPPPSMNPSEVSVPSKMNPPTKITKNGQEPNPVKDSENGPQREKVSLTRSPSEKVFHPPPPLPPPEKLTDKAKLQLDSKTFESPPPVPPPPPLASKAQSNVVVGWAIPSVTPKTLGAPSIDSSSKSSEPQKPPPILVAPPSMASFEKVSKKIQETTPDLSGEDLADTYDVEDDFVNSPWYYDVSKEKATQVMRDCAEIGHFMVRPSDLDQYVLMIRVEQDVVKKFKIQRHENGWVLGDKSNWKRVHQSICGLMDFYMENGIKVGKSTIKLKEAVSEK